MKVLIVGFGSIGKRHLRVIRAVSPDIEVALLRREPCAELPVGVSHCFSKLADAIEFSPNITVVSNPATLHVGTATAFAQAGSHLLVEKPLSSDVSGVDQLLALCESKSLTLMTGYCMRHSKSLSRFREMILEGMVGRVLSVRAEVGQCLTSWRKEGDYRNSVTANKSLGGGALLELSHEIDYIRWIFGSPDRVVAIARQVSSLEMDAEDIAHLLLEYVDQAGDTSHVASITLDVFRQDSTRGCTVIGEEGTLRWNHLDGSIEVFRRNSERWETHFTQQSQGDDLYIAQWKNMIDCVSGRATPLATGHDGLATLRIVAAAEQSSRSGMSVRLEAEDG